MKNFLLLVMALCCAGMAKAQTRERAPVTLNPALQTARDAALPFFEAGDYTAARTRMLAALPLAQTTDEKTFILIRIGETYNKEKQYEPARSQWRQALALTNLDAEDRFGLHVSVAQTYAAEKNFTSALTEMRTLLAFSDISAVNKINAYLVFSTIANEAKEFEQSREALTEVLKHPAVTPEYRALAGIQLGYIELQQKDYLLARAHYEKVLAESTVHKYLKATAQAGIARAYNQAGNSSEAMKAANAARTMWLEIAQSDLTAKNWVQARSALQQAIGVEPDDPLFSLTMYNLSGSTFVSEGDYEGARQAYQVVLEAEATPDTGATQLATLRILQQQAQLGVAQSFVAQKRYDLARAAYDALLAMDSLTDSTKTNALAERKRLDELENAPR